MPPPDVPDGVRRLISEHLESVAQLEVLLLTRAAPEKWWTADEVARAMVTRPAAALGFLRHLHVSGLLAAGDGGFRYDPPAATGADVDELASCYATRRPTIVGLILAGPDEAASSLAEAFRIRRRRG